MSVSQHDMKPFGDNPDPAYKPVEEALSSATHGFGAGMSLVGLIILVNIAIENRDIYQILSFSIFGSTLILLYLASALYHGSRQPRVKRFFKIADHASIFLLIAGSYTPFLMIPLRGQFGWTLLGIIWGLAILGVGFKVFFIQRLQRISVLFYIGMGWMSVLLVKEGIEIIPLGGLVWLAAGGVAYTVGVIFYSMKNTPYMHLVWHFFVLGGSICHYLAVLLYLTPITTP